MKVLFDEFKKDNTKTFLVMFFMCILYVYPIISADRFYIDDLGRSIRGYAGWAENGRPLADLIMIAVYFGMPMVDISPLPLFVGILVLCASISVYMTSSHESSSSLAKAMIGFAFICNPFFLENLSYKYDALTMLLSVSLLFLSYSFKGKSLYVAPVALIICSLSLYQASLTVFCSLAVIEFSSIINSKDSLISKLKLALLRVGQLAIAYLIYSQLIAKQFVTGGYNVQHSQSVFSFEDPAKLLSLNVDSYISSISSYYHKMPDLVFYLFIIPVFILIIMKTIKESKNTSWVIINLVITLLSAIFIYYLTFIHLATLKHPIYAPRVMIPFGCLLMYFLLKASGKSPFYIPAILLISYSFVLSFSYGNAMKSQDRFETYIQTNVSSDISKIGSQYTSISFIGEIPKSEGLKLAIYKFPILRKLIPIHVNNNWVWGGISFLHYGTSLSHKNISADDIDKVCNSTPKVESRIYSIYTLKDSVVVVFDKSKC